MLNAALALECEVPSPHGDGFVTLSIERQRVKQLAEQGRRTPLFEFFYNVCGVVPPVNNVGTVHERDDPPFQDGWGGMKHTHVIFKGVKRPLNGDGLDKNVYVYVNSPRYVYKYIPHMACVAKRDEPPKNQLFVCYVVFDDETCSSGRVIYWEWVLADEQDPRRPLNYKGRYDNEVWANE